METKKTDKHILSKGLQYMLVCLFMMFTGPTLLYIALTNEEKPLYIPLLIISILLCVGAVFFGFKGINTIMKSIFDNTKKESSSVKVSGNNSP
jgi:hypothetical protein